MGQSSCKRFGQVRTRDSSTAVSKSSQNLAVEIEKKFSSRLFYICAVSPLRLNSLTGSNAVCGFKSRCIHQSIGCAQKSQANRRPTFMVARITVKSQLNRIPSLHPPLYFNRNHKVWLPMTDSKSPQMFKIY